MDVFQIDHEAVVAAAEHVSRQAGKQIPEAQVDRNRFSRQVDGGLVIDRLSAEDVPNRRFGVVRTKRIATNKPLVIWNFER